MIIVKERLLSTQITALKIKLNTVFIGEGQYLHIHDLATGESITSTRVFKAAVIHGIQISNLENDSAKWRILLWGQKSLSVVLFKPAEEFCWCVVKEIHLDDWIVDAAWEGNFKYALVATSHNSLMRIKLLYEEDRFQSNDGGDLEFSKSQVTAREQCHENSILYCGCIIMHSDGWEDSTLLAGTVFGQVLIWGPWGKKNTSGRIQPSHRLSGHEGVLFSINYCPMRNVITTTSDDRTLRVWSIKSCCTGNETSEPTNIKHNIIDDQKVWMHCEIVEKYKCFGHGSRVWRSLILPSCFISIGEDSKVCVWGDDGSLLTSWKAHDGSCVWSATASEGADKIITGGGDGSVKAWCLKLDESKAPEAMTDLPWLSIDIRMQCNSLEASDQTKSKLYEQIHSISDENTKIKNSTECDTFVCSEDDTSASSDAEKLFDQAILKTHKTKKSKNHVTSTKKDFPRCVVLLGQDFCLVMMDSGTLFGWDFVSSEWSLVYKDERLKNYAVMECDPTQRMVAMGTLCGNVIILRKESSGPSMKVVADEEVVSSKVFALMWLDKQELLTCGSEGLMIVWSLNVSEGKLQKERVHTLPPCKQRWVSAACKHAVPDTCLLICGDRAGSIHLYSTKCTTSEHSLRSIHGRNGVTSLRSYRGYLYSTGRDGCVRCLTVQGDQLQILTVTRVCNVNWVADLINLCGRLLAVCFHDIKLKLWSLEEDRAVVDIECGGGHRSWSLQSSEDENKLSFLYIKDTKPYLFSTTLRDKLLPLIKTPVNTRETLCLQVLFHVGDTTVFATGGEDTTVRLHAVVGKKLKTINVIRSHISNIRAISCIKNMNGKSALQERQETSWMVSAGGRAQFKIWKATLRLEDGDNEDIDPVDISCREVTSHMLRTGSNKTWKSQEMTFDPETRYMDVTAFWVTEEKALIVLASSDGFLRFFEFDKELEKVKFLISKEYGRCLLKVEKIDSEQKLLLSTATDGKVAIWNIEDLLDWMCKDEETDNLSSEICCMETSVSAHQSGINSITVGSKCFIDDQTTHHFGIATGGDDTKIHVGIVTTGGGNLVSISPVASVIGHASQITGLHWLTEKHLISASIDQRVVIWELSQGSGTTTIASSDEKNDLLAAKLKSASSHFSGVPDIKGLEVISLKKEEDKANTFQEANESISVKRIFIYGVGLQIYDIEIGNT